MISRIIIINFILSTAVLNAQGPLGSWADHLPYHSVNFVAANEDIVLGATDLALTIYNKQYDEMRKLSKVNGLSDCGINTISYSNDQDKFIIAYSSGNIDIYSDDIIVNIPDIYNTSISVGKNINRIRAEGDYAYLASGLGIIVLDLVKNEIKDTWRPSDSGEPNEVFDISFTDSRIIAATKNGVFYATKGNPGLAYYENWEVLSRLQGATFNCLATIEGNTYINKSNPISIGDSIFYFSNNTLELFSNIPDKKNYSFEISESNLVISSGNSISIFNSQGSPERTINSYGTVEPDARNAIIDGNHIYIADRNSGLVRLREDDSFQSFIPPGPYYNKCYNISANEGNIFVSGGTVNNAWNNTWQTFMIFTFKNRQWWSGINYDSHDVMRIISVPDEPDHFFVSTWGDGVHEYIGEERVNHFGESTLTSIIPGSDYVRICGMAIDKNKNLWITQSGIQNSIKVYTSDGEWISLPYFIDAPTIGDIIISESGKKWIVLPRGHGLYVLDDNNTPDYFEDDRSKKLLVKDQDGKLLANIFSVAEDLDGNIWIGTDQGPAVFHTPDQVFDNNISAYRIKMPRNDGTGLADYLLGTETVLSISVDGGNRKWLGTNSSGVFLLSENGSDVLQEYNALNSPLLSNQITSLAVDNKSGEVWIGTDKGIVTVRELGVSGSDEMDEIYAYPNPVRETFNGDVTITGLLRDTNVKITDISGNIVYETRSTGGQAKWDLSGYTGERVSTGVYLIFCTNNDGSQTAVSKLLVIR